MSERGECDICRGARTIRLPIHRPVEVSYKAAEISATDVVSMYREFPCPNCTPTVDDNHILQMNAELQAQVEYDLDPKYEDYIQRHACAMLAEQLHRSGLVTFRKSEPDQFGVRQVRASFGVVTTAVVQSLEQRIAERQMDVAGDVAEKAIAAINNWGSFYRHESLQKDDASRFIMEALRDVREQRKAAA